MIHHKECAQRFWVSTEKIQRKLLLYQNFYCYICDQVKSFRSNYWRCEFFNWTLNKLNDRKPGKRIISIVTSFWSCWGVKWFVGGDVRGTARAPPTLVCLLLRLMDQNLSWIYGGAKVVGPQGLIGASPLTEERGGGFWLPPTLLLVVFLVFWLTVMHRFFLLFGVVFIPETVALKVWTWRREEAKDNIWNLKYCE